MGKARYLIRRIRYMSFGNMFKTIEQVHEKSGKSRIITFFDVIYCGLKYQAGYMDYYQFQMYNMNGKERRTIITRGINNAIYNKYNDPEAAKKFEDKIVFNNLFKDFVKRDFLELTGENTDEFKEFIKKHQTIIAKPVSLACGKGVEKIDTTKEDADALYKRLYENSQVLIEECAVQHKVINDIYPLSINTLRVVTLNKKVVAAFLRIGNDGNSVDNFNHGGMAAAIDINDGIIKFKAIDKATKVYDVHPYTGAPIVGVQIPMWNEVKKFCENACNIIPEVGYVGWDVCLGPDGPSLIEGNDFPGHDIYQLPVHRNDNYGLLPIFEKAMKN